MSFQNPTVAGAADSANLIHTLLVDPSGNLLVNVAAGGTSGTQYADGTTQATPTGTVAIGKNPTNILHALSLDASGNLNVNLAAGTISGGNAAASPTGAAVPASADYLGVNIAGNLVGVTGVSLTNAKAATVAIVDGNGNQITSFGGGTQFADNAASGATPTGTLSMGWDSALSKVRALKVDASQNLNVNLAANSFGTLTVSGTVSVTNFANPLPVSQSGTWTVQPGNTANTTPWLATINQGGNAAAVTVANALKIDGSAVTQPVSGTVTANQGGAPWSADVTDRAARLLGIVYGSQSQQLKQTATNFNLQVELAAGATLYDARSIRALTSSDVVTAVQSTAANLNATVVFPSAQPVSIAATVNVSVQNASLAVTQSTSPWVTQDAADAATGAAVPSKAIFVGANKSGNLVGLSTDASGNLNVNLAAGSISGGNAAASPTGSPVPASADYTGFNSGGNLVGVSSSNPLPVTDATIAANGSNPAPTSSTQVGFVNNNNGNFVSLSGFVSNAVNSLAVTLMDGAGFQMAVGDNGAPSDVVPVGFSAMGYEPIGNKIRALTVDTNQNLKVSVSSLPLPSNAALEAGGNLDTQTALLRSVESLLQLQREQVAVLKAIQLQHALAYGNAVDSNQFIDAVPIQ